MLVWETDPSLRDSEPGPRSRTSGARSRRSSSAARSTASRATPGSPPIETSLRRRLGRAGDRAGLVDELRLFRYSLVVGGGTPFLPPVTDDVPLELIETRTFGLRVIHERYRRARDDSASR